MSEWQIAAARCRAQIPPIPPGTPRPLWSVMIPTYHCARYLGETLASVLRQDPGPAQMEIVVVDDHSTADDPAQVVAAVGRGRVEFVRQPQNVGHIRNFETCLRRARGHLVHLLHGDDQVRDGFYATMARHFAESPALGAAYCRAVYIDECGAEIGAVPEEQPVAGPLSNALERLAVEQRIMTPTMVVRRAVYEHLGGFDRRLVCSEDWEMWVRIAAHYPIGYEPAPLAAYRMHTQSNTGRHVRSGADIHYTRRAIDIFSAYLPPRTARICTQRAKETYALAALESAGRLAAQRDAEGTLAQLREALACSRSWRVWRRLGRLGVGGLVSSMDQFHRQRERIG